MSFKKIIANSILVIILLGANSALAKIPNNIDAVLKPSLSPNFSSNNFLGINIKVETINYRYKNIFPKNIIVENSKASSPLGFQIFCLQNANECKASTDITINYNFRVMNKIKYVNQTVNREITPQNDVGSDKWTLNASVGDCEEYVLAKRSKLAKSGIPYGALRIATATTKDGIGHAVLIVRTNKGDFILDNLTNAITTWDKVEHTLIAISGANPYKWTKIG